MWKLIAMCSASLVAASNAKAQTPQLSGADDFARIEAAQPRGSEIAAFDLAGSKVTIAAYGRRAHARAMNFTQESDEARKHAHVFDRNALPPAVTFEARISF